MAHSFLQMIQHLRREEEVMLYGLLLDIPEEEQRDVAAFLKEEYRTESLDYPFSPPPFNAPAALWAAGIVHTAAQLVVYRRHEVEEASRLLPSYPGEINPGAVLSADLTLRFLPDIITHLKGIDPDDELIGILENHLLAWHYSGVSYSLPVEGLGLTIVAEDKCLLQLYINRVIESKKAALARHPVLQAGVRESMGFFSNIFWNEFKREL